MITDDDTDARIADLENALSLALRERDEARGEVLGLRKQKDGAYSERNKCVAFMAQLALDLGWRVCVGRHPDEDKSWDDDWRTIVFFDTPVGQLSWHLRDAEVPLFDGLRAYPGKWDGHTTEEKYARMASYHSRSRGEEKAAEPKRGGLLNPSATSSQLVVGPPCGICGGTGQATYTRHEGERHLGPCPRCSGGGK